MTAIEVVRLSGGPLHDNVASVTPDQYGVAVHDYRQTEGKRTLGPVLVGVYQYDRRVGVQQGYEIWTFRPLWADAA